MIKTKVHTYIISHIPDYSPETILGILTLHKEALLKGRALKITPHRSMSLVTVVHNNSPIEFFVKHFHPAELGKKLGQKLRQRSNAEVIWEVGQEFIARGIVIPEIIAIVESEKSNESFLITASISHLPDMQKILLTPSVNLTEFTKLTRSQLIAAFAHEWRRLHDAGIYYAESHTRHIYLDINQEYPSFIWVDYDGTKFFPHPLPHKCIIEHFYYLSFHYLHRERYRRFVRRTEMLRFLHEYSSGKWSKDEIKQVARDVLAWKPPIPSQINTILRDSVRYIFRKTERKKRRKRRNRVRKPPR